MTDLTLDTTLDIMLLILGVILLIMPLFFNGFQNKKEIRSKSGKLLGVDFNGLNARGKILISVCILSLTCGIVKTIRDDNSKNKINGIQADLKDTIISLNERVVFLSSNVDSANKRSIKQFKYDSAQLIKKFIKDSIAFSMIQNNLIKKGYSIDEHFNIIRTQNIQKPLVDLSGANHISFSNFSIDGTGMSPVH